MLRIVEMAGSEPAKAYYTAALARADYYVSGGEIVAQWRGRGAVLLGLGGEVVTQETFGRLADNRHPQHPDESLTAHTRTHRRVGYDFNFHAPKGVSVVHALSGDERLKAAFIEAARATMDEAECSMQVRVRTGRNTDVDRVTGNWVYGEFVHLTARPVEGADVPDPHLHCHCTAMNASYDAAEARWKAGQFWAIKREAYYYEAAFHARFARAVQALGYRIEARGKYWDIADVPTSVVDKFSKRTEQIEEFARERGVTDAKEKDRLGARTRAGKRKGLTDAQLKAAWLEGLSADEQAAIQSIRGKPSIAHNILGQTEDTSVARTCVQFAVNHTFERQSVASERRLAEIALRHGLGAGIEPVAVWEEVERLVGSHAIYRRQVQDQWHCTTREAFAETSRCIDFARDGMGRCRALAPAWQIRRPELLLPTAADQRNAIEHVLRAPDRVIAVRGRAGTGKTFASQEIAAALRAAGMRIQALAPTSKAAGVLREEGFADADTVAQMLVNAELQASIAGGVLLVDEAGLLSARQLDRLFHIAREQRCRVLLQYDLAQHRAVERGSPVRDLERYAGLRAAEIHVVRRQKVADYKAAVRDLSRGEYSSAFRRFADMGALVQAPEAQERVRRLASEYLDATRGEATALIVSPTHREGDMVTRAVRAALRADGRLETAEHEVTTLGRLGLTAAQRGQARCYEPGQVIQYTQNVSVQPGRHPAIERGDRLIVRERTAAGKVWVERLHAGASTHGAAFELALEEAKWFDVYEARPITLSVGDRIRITQNGYVPLLDSKGGESMAASTHPPTSVAGQRRRTGAKVAKLRLINNAQYKVARLTKQGDLVLNNGWVLPRDYGHFTYGYCTTSHASQGMTTDTVLISQSSESLGASSSEQFYVSCSRGRTHIRIYTDSIEGLMQAIQRSEQQPSAVDLVISTGAGENTLKQDATRLSVRRRLKEQLARVINFARSCRNNLRAGIKEGVAQILAEGRQRLAVSTGDQSPAVLKEERSNRRKDVIMQDGEPVCGPYNTRAQTWIVSPKSPDQGPPSTQIKPATRKQQKPRSVSVPIFDPEPPSTARTQSI